MASEIIISQRSSGKLLNHLVLNPLLDSTPDLTPTFVASFFAAFIQKSPLNVEFLVLKQMTVTIQTSETLIVLIFSSSKAKNYLISLSHQIIFYANSTQHIQLENELNSLNVRVLKQLVQQLKRVSFVKGICLYIKSLEIEIDENFSGLFVQKEWEDLKEGERSCKWIGQNYCVFADEYLLMLQFDKNLIYGNMADVEIIRGERFEGFEGFQGALDKVYEYLDDIECCIDSIV